MLMITLKVTKNQDFSFSLENVVLEKPQGQLDPPPSLFRVKHLSKTSATWIS